MKKIYLLSFTIGCLGLYTFAQPSVLQSSLFSSSTNTTPNSTNVRLALSAPSGFFNQVRFLVNTVPAGTNTWAFHQGTTAAPDYSICWRPYDAAGAAGAISLGSFIQPLANINSARCNTNSGTDGNLPTITAGKYYTFNITNNSGACAACIAAPSSGGTCNSMEILETSYDPVTISTVSATTPSNAANSVLVTTVTSSAPSSGEYVYVRYSTDGYASSTISQFTFSGATGKALIPCFAGGTSVNYYVYSSNKDITTINADVTSYGQPAHDMATLNLNNNAGFNYSYTQGSGTFFGGIYSAPSTCYATISAFVTALNPGTVTAPVTMYAIGGSATETATSGGISITQTGTAANPIIFQKFGSGSYTIQASAALGVGTLHDAIFELIGSDYVTLDGFTLMENPANTVTASGTNTMTEWGVALLHASTTDGAQYNTIQNNTISLNRSYTNTFGVYSNARTNTTVITNNNDVTNSTTGPNHGNKVYGNTISNVNMGVTFIGSATPAFQDVGNDVGGNSALTGNTISNWGGAAAASGYLSNSGTSYCILMNMQTSENVSYNTLTSAVASGTSATFRGILKSYTTGGSNPTGTFTSNITHNTITLQSAFTSGTFECIKSQDVTAASTVTINIDYNTFSGCALSGAGTTSAMVGVNNTSALSVLSVSNNIFKNNTSVATTVGFTGIVNTGSVYTTINMNNNQVGIAGGPAITFNNATTGAINCINNNTAASTAAININFNSIDGITVQSCGQVQGIVNGGGSATTINMNNNQLGSVTGTFITFNASQSSNVFGIVNNGGTSAATLNIQSNDIKGINQSVSGTNQYQLISSNVAVSLHAVSSNTFTSLSLNTTGNAYLIYRSGNMLSGSGWTCNSNSIVTSFSKTAAGNNVAFLYSTGTSANGSSMSETSNDFSNVTVTGSTVMLGWYNTDGITGAGPTKQFSSNTFNNITCGSGNVTVVNIDGASLLNCTSNTVTSVSGTGLVIGINLGTQNSQGTLSCSSNTINTLSSTGGNVYGIDDNAGSPPTVSIFNNNINDLSSGGSGASLSGIYVGFGTTVNVSGNRIYNLTGTGTTSPLANGIWVSGGTTVNIYSNKVYSITESGVINSSSPAVAGLYLTAGTTTTAYNNFIADLNATNASLTDAVRGISITSVSAATFYNLYYNSIYLNASSAGTVFGTSGIYHTTSLSSTTATLKMINNIIVNTSTPVGVGVTAAYRRSDGTLTNYSSGSDYNLFYAGTPSLSRLIYYDGTNSDQTLAAYKLRVTPRDANSVSLLPTFTSNIDLHLTSANCSIDGAATPIVITTDIDGVTRDASNPDIGADEFTSTSTTTLAGVAGSAICDYKTVAALGTTYTNSCNLIAKVTPSGANPVSGSINTCVTLDDMTVALPIFNSEPYLTRHFDIEPLTSNTTLTSATITLYITQAEFDNYNAKNGAWPDLPTGPGDAAGVANLKVTQYHGTSSSSPSAPGFYTVGSSFYINPVDANIVWNGSYWAVTFDIVGFSGFYVHTNTKFALPVTFNYLKGVKHNNDHVMSWSVSCNTTPKVTLTLERSADQRDFKPIYSITADAVRCQQPFDYTDMQPLSGVNYYRLKITDIDGKITYSNIVALINGSKGIALMNIVPNPVKGNTMKITSTSALPSKLDITITDVQGRIMKRETIDLIAGSNANEIKVGNLAPGTYNVYGSANGERTTILRFVKQ